VLLLYMQVMIVPHRKHAYWRPPPVKRMVLLVRFEVFTAVTMKNGVFWDVTPCGSCKN
jgi:hypothetical protein